MKIKVYLGTSLTSICIYKIYLFFYQILYYVILFYVLLPNFVLRDFILCITHDILLNLRAIDEYRKYGDACRAYHLNNKYIVQLLIYP